MRLPLLIFTLALGLPLVSLAGAESFKAAILPSDLAGDTLRIARDGQPLTIRLFGVAAPLAGQPGADLVQTYLLETAMDTRVIVELAGTDAAGTPVAWVRLPEGATLNEALIRRGLAWWDEPNAPEAGTLKAAAAEAIAAKRGLWAQGTPVAPWDYGKSQGIAPVPYRKAAPAVTGSGTSTTRPAAPAAPQAPTPASGAEEDYFPEDPAEHLALMIKHQPRIALDASGNPLGLTATDIASVPGAKRVGLVNGDVVQSVNGIKLVDEAQVLGLVTQLQDAKQLDLKVLRGGKVVDLTVPLEY